MARDSVVKTPRSGFINARGEGVEGGEGDDKEDVNLRSGSRDFGRAQASMTWTKIFTRVKRHV